MSDLFDIGLVALRHGFESRLANGFLLALKFNSIIRIIQQKLMIWLICHAYKHMTTKNIKYFIL